MTTTAELSQKDIEQLQNKGISVDQVQDQIEHFIKGFPFAQLVRPCTIDDGIIKLTEQEISNYISFFKTTSQNKKLIKFVPASGAASRMFKDLFNYAATGDKTHELHSILLNSIEQFAFADTLTKKLKEKENLSLNENPQVTANYILNEEGLNYGHLPKGLIEFHQYENGSRTAFEEHLVEGAEYAKDKNNIVRIHFTVSIEHQEEIEQHINNVVKKYEEEFSVTYDISYSTQKPSTDTIAVDLNNEPFRDSSGKILFRPGGHGALIENLNAVDCDIVYIKNIDNVVPDKIKIDTYRYKEAIAGLLLDLKNEIDQLLEDIDNNNVSLETINQFIDKRLGDHNLHLNSLEEAHDFLNRPIRICGMVKNEGEPGGGPFWVESNGMVSQQIIESSQVNKDIQEQADILAHATHFNPVDLFCATKNYKDEQFDLTKYRDPETGFISSKSKDGQELKAQELPGLWNGAMANWITLFVEVPIITFNPVKTLKDLLRENHQ